MSSVANFLDSALALAERGFRVFPLIPKTKRPVRMAGDADHFDAATTEPKQIRMWAAQEPTANIGLSPDENFCFLETDDNVALRAACADLPEEVFDTARAGAQGRENRCYYIFRQTMRTRRAGNMTAKREGQENLFEFKQSRMYVAGPGSVHPKTGTLYVADWKTIPAMPDVLLNRLCELFGTPKAAKSGEMSEDVVRELALLDNFLTTYEVATTGEWFNKQKQWYRPVECPWIAEHENDSGASSTCVVYTEGGGYGFTCKHRCDGKTWKEFRAEVQARFPDREFSFGDPGPGVMLGKEKQQAAQVTERAKPQFMTLAEFDAVEPPQFLIDGFLVKGAMAMLAGPVAQRKTIVAINVAHALCTGEKLFGHFPVMEKPERVFYLCPEMGASSFCKRLKQIGLRDYIGKTLFCLTLNQPPIELEDVDDLNGSVVIVDTVTRYVKGDESKSSDMRVFAARIMEMSRAGATVLLLHHSVKGSTGTLDHGLRGSSELAAFVTSCWVTGLEDTKEPYTSRSTMVNVKQRDFESEPFALQPVVDSCVMVWDGKPEPRAEIKSKANEEAENAVIEIMTATPDLSVRLLRAELSKRGIRKGTDWARQAILKWKDPGNCAPF